MLLKLISAIIERKERKSQGGKPDQPDVPVLRNMINLSIERKYTPKRATAHSKSTIQRTNIRAIHDREFSNWIFDIGNGAVGNGKVTFEKEQAFISPNIISKCFLTRKNHHTQLINCQVTRQL